MAFLINTRNAAVTYTGLAAPPADPTDDHYFACQDRLGNITGIMRATSGQTALESVLDYDPFGREIRATGTAAKRLPFHFSSKFTDFETGLAYYGYRYYDPRNGRWLNRDPKEERGGLNLYSMLGNNPPNEIDVLGLAGFDIRDSGAPRVKVYECEVVIVEGHGVAADPVEFDTGSNPEAGDRACGFIGCDAGTINGRIPEDMRLPSSPNWGPDVDSHSKKTTREAMLNEGYAKGEEFCANCGCASVSLYLFQYHEPTASAHIGTGHRGTWLRKRKKYDCKEKKWSDEWEEGKHRKQP